MNSVSFHTLGCKVNQYETEALTELFIDAGYEIKDFNETADIYVINTCTVTNIAAKKSRQLISRAKKKNKDALVVVVGCYAQNEPEKVAEVEGVNLIIGTDQRNSIIELIEAYNKNHHTISQVKDIKKVKNFEELKVKHNHGKTRAYIKIQDGCNQFCSYCIIPYTRGPIRSRKPDSIIQEIKDLANNGYKEVVLTGIHLGSYGKDLKSIDLTQIIENINDVSGLERIRLGSLEPTKITKDFVNRIKQLHKLCPHFHLSLQSACNRTLKEMNRKYTKEQYYESVQLLREHLGDVALTTDIIVGFPGETDEDFKESYEFVKKVGFSQIHVFKYSPREGTKAAARNDQVDGHIKEARSKQMIDLGKEMTRSYIKRYLGLTKVVLVEQYNKEEGLCIGYTDNYINIKFSHTTSDLRNTMVNVRLDYILENNDTDFCIAGESL